MAAGPPLQLLCPRAGCGRAYRSRKALARHVRDKHGERLGGPRAGRPPRFGCLALRAEPDGLTCGGCGRTFANASTLRRHLRPGPRPAAAVAAPPGRVAFAAGQAPRFQVAPSARPQRARHLVVRLRADGRELRVEVRVEALRTARQRKVALGREVALAEGVTLRSGSPALAGGGGPLLLVRTREAAGGKVRPTVFELACGPGLDVASVGTLPVNVLEAEAAAA